MEQNRTISSNTIGNDNYIIQGNVNYNHYASNYNHAETSPEQVDNVLKCLYKSPYKDRKNRNPQRVQGTCNWFVSHEHFRTWNESSLSSMLWVSADPGCGKSVLVRHLVDSIDDFPDQKNIFLQKPSLLSEAILKKFNNGGETFNASFSELWQTFLQVVEDESAGEVVCLLDAIDECEDQSGQGRSQLLKALCTLYGSERSFNIKFLITSGPYVEIHRGLQPLDIPGLPVIHLSGESEDEMKKISQEINTYIDARVQDIGQRLQLTQKECNLLLQRLMYVPNRTYFIYITERMILEATSNIPTTIDEAYERILSRSSNTTQARKIFHFVVTAARPLTLKEVNFALALSEGHQSQDDLDFVPDDRLRENLRDICGLCVTIVDSKIYLLHQTMKEFLVKRNGTQTIQNDSDNYKWKFSLRPQESHSILARICIWHLLAGSKFEHESQSWHAWRHIFLDYSAKHWISYFREMDNNAQSVLTESILTICDVSSHCCKTWFALHWSTMHTNCPQGFTTLIMSLINMDIELNTQDDTYQRSALSWAVRNGFRVVAELLINGSRIKLGNLKLPLRKRSKINLQDKYGRVPLTYAIWNRDIALVKLLMKAGAYVDFQDNLGKTPIFYAFGDSDPQMIDLFTNKKRPVDVENEINKLLFSAAERDHQEVVLQLLKTDKAKLEVKNDSVKLLLDSRANINAQTDAEASALLYASFIGHEEVVKLLLGAGANAKNRAGAGALALICASFGTYDTYSTIVIPLLVSRAVKFSQPYTIYEDSALKNFRQGAHKRIVKLLLEAGAYENIQIPDDFPSFRKHHQNSMMICLRELERKL
ncbi:ankyrin [Trichoderma velutinum]